MSIERPLWLVVCALAAVLFLWALRRAQAHRSASALHYSNLAFAREALRMRRWPERVLHALTVAAASLLALGAGGLHVPLPHVVHNGTVMVCIDTSGSMAATDIDPTRWSAARDAAAAFVHETPSGTRVGIVSFATGAQLIAAPTENRDSVLAALDDLPSPNGATAIGDALQLAGAQLPPAGSRAIIVITDGVNNRGVDPLTVAQELGARHVAVYTVGIGTQSGGVIPGTGEEATIDEDALRAYAQAGGGAYARVDSAGSLRDVLGRLGRATSIAIAPADATAFCAFASGILFAVSVLFGMWIGRFP